MKNKKFCFATGNCNESEFILRFGNERERRKAFIRDVSYLRQIVVGIVSRFTLKHIASEIVFNNGSGLSYSLEIL